MRRAVTATALAACALAAAACGRADSSQPASFADVRAAIADAGLRVCDETATDARPPGATEEHRWDVAASCDDPDDPDAVVVATAYGDEGDRNAAALRFESGLHTPGQGVIWTLGRLTVRVSGDRDPAAVNALTEALDDRGAE